MNIIELQYVIKKIGEIMFRHSALAILVTAIVIFFTACSGGDSDFKGELISVNNLSEIAKNIKEEGKMSVEEIELFTKGIVRMGASKDSVVGKTVEQVIDAQRDYQKEIDMRALMTSCIIAEMNFNQGFKFLGLKPEDSDTSRMNTLFFELKNKSDKDMINMQGFLEFYDQQNQIIKRFPISMKAVLKSGQKETYEQSYNHDSTNSRDLTLRNKEATLQIIWRPTLIEYADGKKLMLETR
jgi:hypothetical protein